MGIRSTNGANDHIEALVRKGALSRDPGKARGLAVVQSSNVRAAIQYAKSDADWLTDVALVCVRHGWDGPAESLPAWLNERLEAKGQAQQ